MALMRWNILPKCHPCTSPHLHLPIQNQSTIPRHLTIHTINISAVQDFYAHTGWHTAIEHFANIFSQQRITGTNKNQMVQSLKKRRKKPLVREDSRCYKTAGHFSDSFQKHRQTLLEYSFPLTANNQHMKMTIGTAGESMKACHRQLIYTYIYRIARSVKVKTANT